MLGFCGALLVLLLAAGIALNDTIGALLVSTEFDYKPRESWGTVQADAKPRPFTVQHDEARWADLKRRIAATRNVTKSRIIADPADPWRYGVPPALLDDFLQRWSEADWPKLLKSIVNKHPQFILNVKGIDIHFVRVRKGKGPGKPLLLLHGWPGSFIEFWKVIPKLAEQINGDVDIIAPSLPGYGYSEAPQQTGMNPMEMAAVFVSLMEQLGHERFFVQGGDWGGIIASVMAQMYPKRLRGVHLNFCSAGPPPPFGLLHAALPSLFLDPRDHHRALPLLHIGRESGYMHQQMTFPDTLAVGLTDSPAGLAAWILDKFYRWSDVPRDGKDVKYLWDVISADEILADIMIYWDSGSISSSMRLYHEAGQNKDFWIGGTKRVPEEVRTHMLDLPEEAFAAPERWVRFKFPGLVGFTRGKSGGHFAALEQPELFAQDVARFVNTVDA